MSGERREVGLLWRVDKGVGFYCNQKQKAPEYPRLIISVATGRNTGRTKSVSELIPCYYEFNNRQKVLFGGEKPTKFSANKAITRKEREVSLHPKKEYTNPIKVGSQFEKYLTDHPKTTYNDISTRFGISKARVCQMVALQKRLPAQITNYLVNTDDPEILEYFTERRLRPLTLLASDDAKLKKFDEMREALHIFR